MTSTDRIARYRETIVRIREDIALYSAIGLSVSTKFTKHGETTKGLIAQQEALIRTYEGIIAYLEGH